MNVEHLKMVALRNEELYFKNKQEFETRMFWLGWKPSEVKQMELYLDGRNERKGNNL